MQKNDGNLTLIKHLINLNGLSISKAADVMKVQRTNLSSWLNGKLNVFSESKIDGMLKLLGMRTIGDSTTGVKLFYMSPEITHRWQIEEGAEAFISVLNETESVENLNKIEIFEINTQPKGRFNLVRRKSPSGDLYILVANKNTSEYNYPISHETIGFGRMAGTIDVPVEKWVSWIKTQALSTSTFRNEISAYIDATQQHGNVDQTILKQELDSTIATLTILKCREEGLKAIIRELLGAVRKLDSKHPMLERVERNKIFAKFDEAEAKKLNIHK